MAYPKIQRLKQRFDGPRLANIETSLIDQLEGMQLRDRIVSGSSVAITVGSRGIANIGLITRTVVQFLKTLGAHPFIAPAMGSHGGGTAEGQRKIIESYGVTEDYVGAPIRSSMEVVQVGETEDGIPVYFDRHAWEADHVVVAGRVKPHTGFVGEIESGLMKMMLIGLGKHTGASIYHRAIVTHSFDRIVRTVGRMVLAKCGIALGVAIIENGYHETAKVEAVLPERFEQREKELLVLAKQWMAKLPFDRTDLLIVDRMGKNISGSGMDTNIIGRKPSLDAANGQLSITRVFVRGLTPETHGNAAGIGLADFTTSRLVREMDYRATVINCLTGAHPSIAVTPVHFETDREVIDAALSTVGLQPPDQTRIIRIKDTQHLDEVDVSETYASDLEGRDDLEVVGKAKDLTYDAHGNLTEF